jgi:hypothetical protein
MRGSISPGTVALATKSPAGVARVGSHVGAALQDLLRAVRAHARQHVDEHVAAEQVDHVRRQVSNHAAGGVGLDEVLGDGERHARSRQLTRVHVAVDPGGGTDAVGVGADREQPELTPLGRVSEALEPDERRVRRRPRLHLGRDLVVREVPGAEERHGAFACAGTGPAAQARRGPLQGAPGANSGVLPYERNASFGVFASVSTKTTLRIPITQAS